jgi:hypothetical protein
MKDKTQLPFLEPFSLDMSVSMYGEGFQTMRYAQRDVGPGSFISLLGMSNPSHPAAQGLYPADRPALPHHLWGADGAEPDGHNTEHGLRRRSGHWYVPRLNGTPC